MKKFMLFFSLMLCFVIQNGYAQQYNGSNDYDSEVSNSDGCCPPEQQLNDCYCLCCRYEPQCYTTQHCEYVPKYTCKKCCRYVPEYYQKQCCRYVPQYYCKTCCRQVPQYYDVQQCHYVPHTYCKKHVRYVPKYYYKHKTCAAPCAPVAQPACAPVCPPSNGCPTGDNWRNDGYNQNVNEDFVR